MVSPYIPQSATALTLTQRVLLRIIPYINSEDR
jgi:hypothetical protein